MELSLRLLAGIGLLLTGVYSNVAGAQASVSVIHPIAFNDGTSPQALVLASTGQYYGVSYTSGTLDVGTLFQIDTQGDYSILHNFDPATGGSPTSIVVTPSGDIYGIGDLVETSSSSAYGVVFHYSSSGYQVVYTFSSQDGEYPRSLVLGSDGNLYGVTLTGGRYNGGTVFQVIPSTGAFKTIYAFNPTTDGTAEPEKISQLSDGNFYGVTNDFISTSDTQIGYGSVFKLTPSGTLSILHSFSGKDGSLPSTKLVPGPGGALYGATANGGNGCPSSPVQDSGCGTLYKITTGGTFTSLHDFTAHVDGNLPTVDLVYAADGNFYGATDTGGPTSPGCTQTVVRTFVSARQCHLSRR